MPPEPGISRQLARERASRVSNVRYELRLSVPRDREDSLDAALAIAFTLADASAPLALDFAPNNAGRLISCTVNGRPVGATVEQGHVVLPPGPLVCGANRVELLFKAGDGSLSRRDDHLYSIFVPARAHEAFPCFDQPDLRARFALALDLPEGWTGVTNSDVSREPTSADGRTTFTFAETAPIPTYLFAFAAGRLLEDTVERDGRELRIYRTAADPAAYAASRDAIASGHVDALNWLEQYTGLPYAFGKFDIVLLPAFQFGGMEHPGAVFYNAATLLLPASATRQQLLARDSVIAHETAHMWFGDLVTMTWFDDVWMKEVFANFMAAKIVNPRYPDLDHDLRFLHTHYPAAYDVDRTAGANPIRQPLENLKDAGSLYGAIVYLKSPIVMRQLELLLGEAALCDALREYLSRFAFGHAAWPDLLQILQTRTTTDLSAWSSSWLETAGRPAIESALVREPDDSWRVDLTSQAEYAQQLDIAVGYQSHIEHTRIRLLGQSSVRASEPGRVPDFVLPNGRGLGYGEFLLDDRSLTWLMAHLPDVGDALTRGSAWLTLWDAMLSTRIAPENLLDLAVRAVPVETNELNLQRMLHDVERLFWVFLPPGTRGARAASLEEAIRRRLDTASSITMKAAAFGSLRSIATTSPGVAWLRSIWSDETEVDGLPLGEADYVALSQELAVRAAVDDGTIERQLARTESRDRHDALAFVAPALSAEPSARESFFRTISDASNRRREPWVVEGMRWLHHPLRAEASRVYIRPALDLLEEVKRTGDIFLPKRWLDALLGGHSAPEAALIVREFLATCPENYPAALRRTVLASADHLFRASSRFTSTRTNSL